MSRFSDTIHLGKTSTPDKYIEYAERALVNLYKHPIRAYHDWNHVLLCIAELDEIPVTILSSYRDYVALAIYYHDCIYDPKKSDNEKLSAERAFVDLMAFKYTRAQCTYIYDLIMLTTHTQPCSIFPGQILMDIDLSILGKNEMTFLWYEQAIRKEYRHVPPEKYATGRANFLKSILDKEHIYQTDYFRHKYEITARKNIKQSIEKLLSGQVGPLK